MHNNSQNDEQAALPTLTLKALQQAFSQTLLYQPSEVASQLKEKPGFTADELLQIHRNNFVISVTESLKAVYRLTLQLVGDAFFESVARHYLLQTPPKENNIRVYGKEFPTFLNTLPQLATLPYVVEMAKFESIYEQAQNLPLSSITFDAQSLQEVAADEFPNLQFLIRSDCVLFKSSQNINVLFNMINSGEVTETDLNQHCYLLLQKHPDFSIEIMELTQSQWLLIEQLQHATTLEQIQPTDLQEELSHLLTKQLICGFTINSN